jgi:hypothetical protein
VGRVVNQLYGACTATLVGRRHIITASHCAIWSNFQDESPPGPMIFQPGYNGGPIYPPATVRYGYWLAKFSGDAGWQMDQTGGDWLVGILDRDMGSTNGVFGQQQYESKWNDQYLWNAIGYSNDFTQTAELPVIQSLMAVRGVRKVQYGEIYYVEGDGYSGDSGGPLYGTFAKFPALVGTICSATAYPVLITIHGGPAMFGLIAKAKAENP